MTEAVTAVFRQPFPEQLAAWRLRLARLAPTSRWDDLAGAEHDRAFMVAGATKADLLADLAAAVDRAISEGRTLDEFRRDFRQIVETRGWHGWTGEGTKKGEAWRTRVIYRTNIATTYAAGRHAQLVAGNYRFWVYRHGNSLEPRVLHLSWDGVALPPDHPFWAAHFPPNDWGCSCRAFGARTQAGIRRVGGDPGKTLPPGWDLRDPKTGTPPGIGKGWDHAPGATVDAEVAQLAAKPVSWPYEIAKAYMQSLPAETADRLSVAYRGLPGTADALTRFAGRIADAAVPAADMPPLTLGLATSAQRDAIARGTGIQAAGFDYLVDTSALRHVFERHGNPSAEAASGQLGVTAADLADLLKVIDAPDRVSFPDSATRTAPLVQYEKRIGDRTITAIFEVRRRRQRIALVTFWMRGTGKS